jgi:multidrug transporter EmrE-like cation transporter
MKHAYTWGGIAAIVVASIMGDVLISRAMKRVGNVGSLWRSRGFVATAARMAGSPTLWLGIACMILAFFSLITALSWADVSLVGPASASLTFLGNAVAGKFLLHENVDKRRWMAAVLVSAGVALIAL